MARVPKALLYVGNTNKTIDLAQEGLISLEFNKFAKNISNPSNTILQDVQISIFDKTGYTLLSNLQTNSTKIYLKYGWADNLSDKYKLTMTKYKIRYESLGIGATIYGVGDQVNKTFDGEAYTIGTSVKDILISLAKRNGWYIGQEGSTEFINVKDTIRLTETLVKTPTQTDFDFIEKELKPILNKTVTTRDTVSVSNFWEVILNKTSSRTEFYCRPYTDRSITRRVWRYTHGSAGNLNSEIISVTNDIDMSFLLNGLTIRMPITAAESSILPEGEDLDEYFTAKVANRWESFKALIKEHNLPMPDVGNFSLKVELVTQDNVGNKTFDDYIIDKLEEAVMVLNTIDLVVVGNPDIQPTDLIELTVKNRDGTNSIISSTGKSVWRVLEIKEVIGLVGYQTHLKLTRQTSNLTLPTTTEKETVWEVETVKGNKTIRKFNE